MQHLEVPAGGDLPSARRRDGALRRAYRLLTSPKLAITLLVTILGCCVVGVTLLRGERAWRLIFDTLWFNALLVLLAVSSAAAFFTRIWRRKLTVVSVGMIVFHVSFAALLGGVVFNSLFHFKGAIRLTEGETLPNDRYDSYDLVEHGRLFDMRRLKGETTLVRMHRAYNVDGKDKRAAYEIAVGEGDRKTSGVVYVTQDLEHEGVRYLRSKEGYSVLVVVSAPDGEDLYGAYVPLQSLRQPNGSFVYAAGSAKGPEAFAFPQPPEEPRMQLMLSYRPSSVAERQGEVAFHVTPLGAGGEQGVRSGQVVIGGEFDAGAFKLSPREVRYWVGMDVRRDPGLNVILASLCFGLAGMTTTFVGRLRQGGPRRRAQARPAVEGVAGEPFREST